MKKIFVIFAACLFAFGGVSWADTEFDDFQTLDELLFRPADDTPCATAAFADALAANASAVSENDDKEVIEK